MDNLLTHIASTLVDTAFPLPPTTPDFCRPDSYPPFPLFPFRLPDPINYTRKEVEDDA